MENINNKIISTRTRIMTTVKKFKEKIGLHNNKITEKSLNILEKSIKFHEDLANAKDENDIEYLIDRFNYFENLFKSFLVKYNIDQTPEESAISNSTFIKTLEWLSLKKSVLNPSNNDNNCFQYSILPFLYHEQLGRNYCRISKIKQNIDNFNWQNINIPPQEQDYQSFEINNKSIALNVLQLPNNEHDKKISHLYKSEFNKTREKQVILLILTDDEKQHYVAVKNLNSLLKDKNKCSEHFCINCFKKFRTKSRLEKHYQSKKC